MLHVSPQPLMIGFPDSQIHTTDLSTNVKWAIFTRALNQNRCGYWSSTFELTTFPMYSISSEFNARHQLSRWSISRLRNLFGTANFAPDSSSQQRIPEPSRPLGEERRAKKTDSAGIKIFALSGDSLLPIFDCNNCGGTHKSMNRTSDCQLCKSKGLDIQFPCPKISNAAEKKKNQLPRKATEPAQQSVKSATSGSKKTAGSIISAITQDDESYTEEDSKVSDYPVYVDTCASDIYTPLASNLDADSSHIHTRLKVEQADGTKLVSSGIGKLCRLAHNAIDS